MWEKSVHREYGSQEPAPAWLFILAIVFLLIGLAMLPGSVYFYVKEKQFEKIAVSAPGTVVDLAQRKSTSRSNQTSRTREVTYYHPIVQFIDQKGHTQELHSANGSNPPDYRRGDKVMVLYEPDNPEFAVIDNWQRYLWVIVFIILGFAFTSSSALIWWLAARSRNQQK